MYIPLSVEEEFRKESSVEDDVLYKHEECISERKNKRSRINLYLCIQLLNELLTSGNF